MVQVFNPQALGDPGPTAALGGLSSTVASLLGQQNNQANNKNALLQALLGQLGQGSRELLATGRENAQGRSALDFAIQSGQLPGLEGTTIPSDLKIAPSSVNALLSQSGLNALLGRATKQSQIGKTASEAGIPGGDELITGGTNAALGLLGGFGGSSGQGTQIQPQPMSPEPIPQQTGAGGFKLGAQESDATLPAQDQNLIAKQARIKTEKEGLQLQGERLAQAATSPEYLRGVGNGADAQAVDLAGIPLGIKMNPGLTSARFQFARKTPDKQSEITDSVTDAASTLDDFSGLRNNVLKFRRDGTIGRLKTTIAANGAIQYILPDNPSDQLVSTVQFLNNSFALATKLVKATGQSGTGISDRDVRNFQQLVGDPNKPEKIFIAQSNDFIAKSLTTALRNSALVDASQFQALKGLYEDTTGTPLPEDFMTNTKFISNTRQALIDQMGSQKESNIKEQIIQRNTGAAPASQVIQQPIRPAPQSSNGLGGKLNLIDEILKRQGVSI